jgi:hypothetical protein
MNRPGMHPSVLLLAIMLLAIPLASFGQSPAERVAHATFTVAEREIIRQYFEQHREHYKPRSRGRGRDGGLPPGIARNLARGKPLPPGIARQFPDRLASELPPSPDGFERIYIDDRVLLVEIGTQLVHDILSDLL